MPKQLLYIISSYREYKSSDNYSAVKIFVKLFTNYFAANEKRFIFASLFQKATSKSGEKQKSNRAFSSAGSERLPYKQRVGGSNPSTPTTKNQALVDSSVSAFFYSWLSSTKHLSVTEENSSVAWKIFALNQKDIRYNNFFNTFVVVKQLDVYLYYGYCSVNNLYLLCRLPPPFLPGSSIRE